MVKVKLPPCPKVGQEHAQSSYPPACGIYLPQQHSNTVEIRQASMHDKEVILDFCGMIYPEGDYIHDTWNTWCNEEGLYVMWEDKIRVGVYNVTTHAGQAWIEGMRVHPDFRGSGYGMAMMRHAEDTAKDNGARIIRSLIETGNHTSITQSRKNGYTTQDTWNWYEIADHNEGGSFSYTNPRSLHGMQYVDSWRVYDLDDDKMVTFLNGSAITVIPSLHFLGTTIITVLDATDLSGLASYLSSKFAIAPGGDTSSASTTAASRDVCGKPGTHIVSRIDESMFKKHFSKISSYFLMAKNL